MLIFVLFIIIVYHYSRRLVLYLIDGDEIMNLILPLLSLYTSATNTVTNKFIPIYYDAIEKK